MQSLNDLVGKKVALVDRGFVLVEGRIVYPTATGTLVACEDKALRVQMIGDSEITVFFVDALRCVREAPPEAKPAEPAEPAAEG